MEHLIKVLYIEDNEQDREALTRAVADKGLSLKVTPVDTPEKARNHLAQSTFDLIIARYPPPGGRSAELLEEISHTPFVLLTDALQQHVALRDRELRADDYLLKDSEGHYLDALPFTFEKTLYRKQVEDQLRWAQERYSALFDRSMDLIYLLDLDGRLIDANPAALELFGYTRDEIPSVDLLALLDPEQMPLARQRMEKVLREGYTTQPAEFKLTSKDGREVFVETKGSIVLHNGKPCAIQGIGRDITDRKRAEAALRESEDKFRGLAENMNAAAGIVQGQRFVYANRFMAQMLGYTVEEILSLDFPRLVHPADRERMIDRARRRHMGETVPGNYEFMALTKNGETRWIDFSVGSMIYQGKPAIIGTGIDITERKKAEEKLTLYTLGLKLLADSATRLLSTDRPSDSLRGIFDDLADHLGVKVYVNYLVDEDGRWLHLQNQRGLDPGVAKQIEFIDFGQLLCGTSAQEQRPVIVENVQQSVEPKAAFLRPLGIRAYACHPLLGSKGVIGTLSFCAEDRDSFSKEELELMRATSHQVALALEHQRLADELERRATQLTEANAAKDHFLAVLSHELRTPLTPVVMGVSMLQDKPDLDPRVRETLDMVRQNVEMEARLIDDLLDVTRIARGKIELRRSPVELCTVIQRAIDVCYPDIEARGLHFSLDLGPVPPYWVQADISRMQQVFWNLLKNAIKFTPHGGCVGIRCRPDEDHVVIEVNDSGIGIDPQELPRIFKAFEQTELSVSRQFGGLGLGLAISKALVDLHGGEIDAVSEGRDQGATFRIRLPLCAPAGQSEVPAAAMPKRRAMHPLRVLLVEDHGVTAQMIRMVLAEKGHNVETAGDVSTALTLANGRTFDLLLSDLGLPDGSGHDLMRELRARGHSIPGIALSGYGQESDIRRSYEAGFIAHLIKPASRESVLEAVESAAAGISITTVDSSKAAECAIPAFDPDAALKQCFGKPETLREMMNFLPAEATELLSQIAEFFDRKDFSGIGKAAHRLKGTVVYLAAQPATKAVLRVEEAAKTGNLTETGRAITEMKHQIELLKEALASHPEAQDDLA